MHRKFFKRWQQNHAFLADVTIMEAEADVRAESKFNKEQTKHKKTLCTQEP